MRSIETQKECIPATWCIMMSGTIQIYTKQILRNTKQPEEGYSFREKNTRETSGWRGWANKRRKGAGWRVERGDCGSRIHKNMSNADQDVLHNRLDTCSTEPDRVRPAVHWGVILHFKAPGRTGQQRGEEGGDEQGEVSVASMTSHAICIPKCTP